MKPHAQIVIATKEIIDALLAMNTRNRPIRRGAIERYKRDIQNGRWLLTNQGIGVSDCNVIIDGQHRLIAIKECGYPPVPLLIVYGLEFEAQAIVDQQSKRSPRDILAFVFNARVVRAAPAIAAVIMKEAQGWNHYTPTMHETLECIQKHMDEIEMVTSTPTKMNFYAAPFLAAFTLEVKAGYQSQVIEFMKMVETGELLTRDMPAFHLRNLIFGSKGACGGHEVQKERFWKCQRAVRAFIKGDKMGVLRA